MPGAGHSVSPGGRGASPPPGETYVSAYCLPSWRWSITIRTNVVDSAPTASAAITAATAEADVSVASTSAKNRMPPDSDRVPAARPMPSSRARSRRFTAPSWVTTSRAQP